MDRTGLGDLFFTLRELWAYGIVEQDLTVLEFCLELVSNKQTDDCVLTISSWYHDTTLDISTKSLLSFSNYYFSFLFDKQHILSAFSV